MPLVRSELVCLRDLVLSVRRASLLSWRSIPWCSGQEPNPVPVVQSYFSLSFFFCLCCFRFQRVSFDRACYVVVYKTTHSQKIITRTHTHVPAQQTIPRWCFCVLSTKLPKAILAENQACTVWYEAGLHKIAHPLQNTRWYFYRNANCCCRGVFSYVVYGIQVAIFVSRLAG